MTLFDANPAQRFYDADTSGRSWVTFTIPEGTERIAFGLRLSKGSRVYNPQLEYGSEPTEYQPYVGTVYGGYVDLISGELENTYGIYTFEENGNYEYRAGSVTYVIPTVLDMKTGDFYTDQYVVCDRAKKVLSRTTAVNNELQIKIGNGNNRAYLYNTVGTIGIDNETDFRQWIKDNPISFTYPLTTPITHQLTPTQLSSFIGQNNFWSNADYVEIEYELKETEDIQKARKKIILNQPHIESITGDAVSFTTDMKAPLKECKVYFSPIQEGSGDPSPDNVRNIVGWDKISIGLPNEYQEVEYIESTGTQYIDTGITLDANDFAISFNFEQTNRTSGEQPITSIWTDSYNYWNLFIRSLSSDKYVLDTYTSKHHILSTKVNLNEIYNVSLTRNGSSWEFTQNDSTITWTYSPSTANNTTLKLFKRGDLNTGNATKIKMYSFKMTVSNTKTLNLIPCYRKSDNEIGMYDIVSKTFFTNSGTGTFLKGADVNTIIGNVNWLDEIGTVYGGYVDLVKGELVATHVKYEFTGDEDIILTTYNGTPFCYRPYTNAYTAPFGSTATVNNCFCNILSVCSSKFHNIPNNYITTAANSAYSHVLFRGDIFGETVSSCKEKLAELYANGTPLTIVAPIRDTVLSHYTYQLTPQQLLTLKGTNNIWSDTNGQTEVKFWTH